MVPVAVVSTTDRHCMSMNQSVSHLDENCRGVKVCKSADILYGLISLLNSSYDYHLKEL